jgi:RHS repeat-associated protein
MNSLEVLDEAAGSQRTDELSEPMQFRNRDYSMSLGRWMQKDPAGFVDGMSLYQYAGNAPAARVDPLGLQDQPTATPAKLRRIGIDVGNDKPVYRDPTSGKVVYDDGTPIDLTKAINWSGPGRTKWHEAQCSALTQAGERTKAEKELRNAIWWKGEVPSTQVSRLENKSDKPVVVWYSLPDKSSAWMVLWPGEKTHPKHDQGDLIQMPDGTWYKNSGADLEITKEGKIKQTSYWGDYWQVDDEKGKKKDKNHWRPPDHQIPDFILDECP